MTQVKSKLKQDLLNLEYQKVIDQLFEKSTDKNTTDKLNAIKNNLIDINNKYYSKKITSEQYFNEINTIVMNIVQIINVLEKEDVMDEWDFFEQLNNSLKLNLIKDDIDKINQYIETQSQIKFKESKSAFQATEVEKNIEYLKSKLNELLSLINKYEKLLEKTNDPNEKQKYNAIIEGIKFQFYQDAKKLKDLNP